MAEVFLALNLLFRDCLLQAPDRLHDHRIAGGEGDAVNRFAVLRDDLLSSKTMGDVCRWFDN